MKAVVAAFNQEKALVGAFSLITNLRMELFEALIFPAQRPGLSELSWLREGRDDVVLCRLLQEVATGVLETGVQSETRVISRNFGKHQNF